MRDYWSDGTVKSQGNAFTAHGYTPGSQVADTPVRPQYKRGGFGTTNGTIQGMGVKDPRAFTLHTRKRQRA